jgi:predicted Zn-dependent protease
MNEDLPQRNQHWGPMAARRKLVRLVGLLVLACAASYGVAGWIVRSSAVETLREADQRLRSNEPKSARQRLRWLIWFEPENTEALLIIGISHHVEKNFPDAIRVLERVSAESSEFEGASLTLARSLLHEHQLDRAESVLKKCLRRFPRSDPAREELLQMYMRQIRRRESLTLLYERWRLYPDDLTVLRSLLKVLVEPIVPQGLFVYFSKVNAERPRQAAVVLALARINALMGKAERADHFFRAALELRPGHLPTHLLSAEFFWSNGDRNIARDLLLTMSNSNFAQGTATSDDRFWAMVAKVREADGKLEDASAAIQNALAIRPNSYTLMSWKCGLLRRMNRHHEAEELAARASRISDAKSQLFVRVNEVDLEAPTKQQCSQFGRLLDELGYTDQADGWRFVRGLANG